MPGPFGRFHGRVALVVFGRAGRHIEAPYLFAGRLVVGGDIAASADVGASLADDDLAVEGPRCAGDGLIAPLGQGLDRPQEFSRLGVEREQPAVQRGGEDLAIVVGGAPIDRKHREVQAMRRDLPGFRIVFPQQLAGGAIHRIDGRVAACEVEHAVDRDGSCLKRGFVGKVERPGKAQPRHVSDINLSQPAVIGLVGCACVT